MHNLTQQLNQWIAGDRSNEQQLFKQLYPRLRHIAHKQLIKAKSAPTNTTLIVNEAYLRLVKQNEIKLHDRLHFFALSARVIRCIILDDIRQIKAAKRGHSWQKITLQNLVSESASEFSVDILSLNKALDELGEFDPLSVRIIELRFFAGLTIKEIAQVCNVSDSTISKNWRFARSWLLNKLEWKITPKLTVLIWGYSSLTRGAFGVLVINKTHPFTSFQPSR